MVDYKKAIKDRHKDIKSKCSICKKPYEFIKTEIRDNNFVEIYSCDCGKKKVVINNR